MTPSKEWLEKYEQVKNKLVPGTDLNAYFTQKEIAGKKLDIMDIGTVNFPSGELIVCDPLAYIDRKLQPYIQKVPSGEYTVKVCVIVPDESGDCARYAAAGVEFSKEVAVRYEEALVGIEDLNDFEEGNYFGFNVDAGLGCIVDRVVRDAYCDFEEKWMKENPEGNTYDDYFSDIFEESYKNNPQYQRNGGDWINWTVPGTDYRIPMFASGFGDGAYPVYMGYDSKGNVCNVVIEFIDIPLAYDK